eukprot:scaffold98632_cov54-Phaeocystis_antarctica.AAC.3
MPTEARKGDSEAFVLALLDGNEVALNELVGRNHWLVNVPSIRELNPAGSSLVGNVPAVSPLTCVIQLGKTTLVQTLLWASADPSRFDDVAQTSPLYEACLLQGQITTLQLKHPIPRVDLATSVLLLLKHHADPNPEALPHGMTPLLISCGVGFPEVVEELLAAGADLGSRNVNGCNSLFAACSRADLEVGAKVTRLLLQHLAAAFRSSGKTSLLPLLEVRSTESGPTCGFVRDHSNTLLTCHHHQQQQQQLKLTRTYNYNTPSPQSSTTLHCTR